ncbi:MAG TPA: hypothetical protein VN875_17855 [Candidatus Binatus sp.]|nr:hypothetical protein [Candidatus Binatus sp.]
MRSKMNRVLGSIIYAALTIAVGNAVSPVFAAWPSQANQADQQSAIQKQVGAIKSIVGTTVTITTDSAATASVNVTPATKIVRVEPGQTDLKNAVPLELKDLQVGDRVFIRWKASDTAQPVSAIGIIVMKRADVDAKQQHEREDWQKRSVGGLVTTVDPATKTMTLSVTTTGGKKSITINTTPKTVFRRYAPDSVKFDEAKVSSLDRIMPGDQLRALGARNADGTAVDAEVVVTGSFRNIAGTIISVDPASNTITVNDLIAKKPVAVKVSDQTQLRKLAPEVAQRIAFRLKAAAGGATQSGDASADASNGNRAPGSGASASTSPNAPQGGPGGAGRSGGGQADLQQILNRMPASSLADFQKGDVVMVVSTEGTESGGGTAITVVGGVDPILAASPSASQAMTLSPWSLGGSSAMDAAGNP